VRQGVDLVVNLAAGLNTRPYRMTLPAELTWIEVDLPEILDYKEEILGTEKPACMVERVRLDLADRAARRALFATLGKRSSRGLVISKGLIIYFSAEEAGALAEDIANVASFEHWAVDIASPGLLALLQKNTNAEFGEGVSKKTCSSIVPLPSFGWTHAPSPGSKLL
jgi:O-methyltransferase involved in polyketide biosynthesis